MRNSAFPSPDPDPDPELPADNTPETSPPGDAETHTHAQPVPTGFDPTAGAQLTEHPAPLTTATGILVVCPACHAQRDWLLIVYAGGTWVRCRCAHEWAPPDVLADYDDEPEPPDRYWDTLEHAIVSMGYDGFLAGSYYN